MVICIQFPVKHYFIIATLINDFEHAPQTAISEIVTEKKNNLLKEDFAIFQLTFSYKLN